jgi:hypothetical protein
MIRLEGGSGIPEHATCVALVLWDIPLWYGPLRIGWRRWWKSILFFFFPNFLNSIYFNRTNNWKPPSVTSLIVVLCLREPTKITKLRTTLSNGYLGSRNDEERSEMRYVMRIAELRESSNLWTQIALFIEHASLSIGSTKPPRRFNTCVGILGARVLK